MTTDPTEVWKRAAIEASRRHLAGRQRENRRAKMAAAVEASKRPPADIPDRADDCDAESLRRGMLT